MPTIKPESVKVLLIQPPIEDFYETDVRLQPIGLAYLKAAVNAFLPDVSVEILDFHTGWGRKSIPIPKDLSDLGPYYAHSDRSPFSSFHQYFHYGADNETIAKIVAGKNPTIVGVSSLFSPYYRESLQCARAIKKSLPQTITLFGGSHVNAYPESVLSDPSCDYIIRGEGERPLVEFLEKMIHGITPEHLPRLPNLGFKREGQVFLNDIQENFDLNDLPIPDLSDFHLDQYQYCGQPLSFLITSRSCPHRCSFCSVHQTFGTRFRRRRIDLVLSEIQKRYDAGYRVLDFEDDNLTFYLEEMKELCRLMIQNFPKGDLQLVAMNGISYLSLDDEVLVLMRRAGFSHLNLALVSSDQTVRETTKRPHTIEKYLAVVNKAFELGFKITSYQILGLPSETLESMIQTLCFHARLPVLLGASPFYLTPNSPIARTMGILPSDKNAFRSRLTAMGIGRENANQEEVFTLFIATRILNFLKGLDFEDDEIMFSDILKRKSQNFREQIGLELLQTLFKNHILYANTPNGLKKQERFLPRLFFRLWRQLKFIQTQGRPIIRIDE